MKRSWVIGTSVLGLVCGGAAGAISYADGGSGVVQSGAGSRGVNLGAAEDRLPSTTAADWVTYADHVLVVTPSEEAAVTESSSDTGGGLVNREVTFDVENVVWSSPRAAQPAPKGEVSWLTWGWVADDDGNLVPFATEGAPRLELGHTYIVAVSWEEARCSPGDPMEPAHWAPLGSAAIVPYDESVIGAGEFEGVQRGLNKAREEARASQFPTVGQRLVGKSRADLAQLLAKTNGGTEKTFTEPAPC